MKIWYNTKFDGHYPVGSAAIVSAKTKEEAAVILGCALVDIGLKQKIDAEDMIEFDTDRGSFAILRDGNY